MVAVLPVSMENLHVPNPSSLPPSTPTTCERAVCSLTVSANMAGTQHQSSSYSNKGFTRSSNPSKTSTTNIFFTPILAKGGGDSQALPAASYNLAEAGEKCNISSPQLETSLDSCRCRGGAWKVCRPTLQAAAALLSGDSGNIHGFNASNC